MNLKRHRTTIRTNHVSFKNPAMVHVLFSLYSVRVYQYRDSMDLCHQNNCFRTLLSTVTPLCECSDSCSNDLSICQMTRLIFIDLKGAFHTIEREVLSKKLFFYSVPDKQLERIKSYLSIRGIFYTSKLYRFKIREIEIGVSQRSCLVPLLLMVFINSLSLAIKNSKPSVHTHRTSIHLCSTDLIFTTQRI